MPQEELSIERVLEIVNAGSYDLKRFYEHYLRNPGVFLAIVEKADERQYYKPRKLVRRLIADIGLALENKASSAGILSDAAVSLKLLIDIICTDEDAGPNDIVGVSEEIIPGDVLPTPKFVDAMLLNFHYRMFPPQQKA